MVITGGILLLVNAAWNFLVWPPFLFRRVLRDPRARDERGQYTSFLRFNVALIAATFLIGLLSLIFGLLLILTPSIANAG
ncbi:MAG: hypothetical protein QOC59_1380 [Microbacteriaceae bacterium]|jgi:hypothetical protein|nr:hypothetical protein [Microbacteriaceae bacterium]